MIKLFLDDYRSPEDCLKYCYKWYGTNQLVYNEQDWAVVKNYPEFVNYIQQYGIPDLISFDHDLADEHYHQNMQEGKLNYYTQDFLTNDCSKTGYHCAKWLTEYCMDKNLDLPQFMVHSMNPVGRENIITLLENFKTQWKRK